MEYKAATERKLSALLGEIQYRQWFKGAGQSEAGIVRPARRQLRKRKAAGMGDGLKRVSKACGGLSAEDKHIRKVWNMCLVCDGQRVMTLDRKTGQYVIDLPSCCTRKDECAKFMKPGV